MIMEKIKQMLIERIEECINLVEISDDKEQALKHLKEYKKACIKVNKTN